MQGRADVAGGGEGGVAQELGAGGGLIGGFGGGGGAAFGPVGAQVLQNFLENVSALGYLLWKWTVC